MLSIKQVNGVHEESNFLAVSNSNVTDEMNTPTVSGNMRNIAILLALSVIPTAKAGVLVIANPDTTYIASTTRIPITGPDLNDVSSVSDGIATVTFSDSLNIRTIPDSWGSWSSPPNAESSMPKALATNSNSLTLTFNEPLDIFGVEVEPNNFEVYQITASFFNGTEMVGTFSQDVVGMAGARLFAAQATDGDVFTSMTLTTLDDSFAIAQPRYSQAIPESSTLSIVVLGLGLCQLRRRAKLIHP